jgi:hypothetical protein
MTYTIYYDRNRRMRIVAKDELLRAIDRLLQDGYTINSVQ